MNKDAFIRLIQAYKGKALAALEGEVRATAISMIPADVMAQLDDLNEQWNALLASWKRVSLATAQTAAGEALRTYDKYCTSLIDSAKPEPRNYKDRAIQMAMKPLFVTPQYRERYGKITKQFDEAVAKAKKLNSTRSLTELANLLDIPVGDDGVEIEAKRSSIDVPFIKQQINQVKALA